MERVNEKVGRRREICTQYALRLQVPLMFDVGLARPAPAENGALECYWWKNAHTHTHPFHPPSLLLLLHSHSYSFTS